MNKKKSQKQTGLSYYGLYLLNYLQENRFEQATDTAFIQERAEQAAATYERARLDGYPVEGAQELAMTVLVQRLHHSRYSVLHEVIEKEFSDEVPEEKRDTVLLYYFFEMSDPEIAKLLNISRSTVQYRRTSSFELLKRYLEERAYDEEQ